jgi:MFS family permease
MRTRGDGLWRHPEFLKLWAASAITDVGTQISAVALPLIAALTLHATPWQMGLLGAAGTVPMLLVGLFAGVWVDRLRRRPVMIAADVGRAVLLSAIPLAAAAAMLRIEVLYVVALAVGALNVLFDVAFYAFIPALVSRERLVEANAKLETTSALAQVTGPGAGGALVAVLGGPIAVLIDALSFLLSAVFTGRIRVTEAAPRREARESVLAEIREGVSVVARHSILRVLGGCSATIGLFGRMFFAVYVLYMTRDLGLGAVGVGLVFATGGVGSLAGALVAERIARRFGPGPTMIGAQLLFGVTGLAVPLAVLVPRYALELVVASEFAQWMTLLVYYINAISVRQALTPDRLLGRVTATMRFAAGGALPIGSLLGGAIGGIIGLPLTLVVAEFGMLLASLWLLLSPVRRLHTLDAAARIEAAPAIG